MEPARAILFPAAAAFAAGIWATSQLHPDLSSLTAGLAATGLLWFAASRCPVWLRYAASCAFLLLAGALTAELHRPSRSPELNAAPGEVLLLSGCISGPVAADRAQSRFILELAPGARVQVTLTAREGETLPKLRYGQTVEVEARVRYPRNFRNPGAFDYVRYLARQQIYWTATARGVALLRVLPAQCGTQWRRQALAVREAITRRVHSLYPRDAYLRQVLPALLTGDDAATERDTTEDYRRTGTYHALVVSGLHITVVAGSVRVLMRLAGVSLGLALLIPAAVAWLYAGVVNWEAPVVRSAAGFTLFLAARWVFRRGSVLNLLAAVALILLAVDPEALFDAGFQLTFLSVAALGGIAAPAIARTTGPYADGLRLLGEPATDHKLQPLVRQWRIELRLLIETASLLTRIPVPIVRFATISLLRPAFLVIESILLSASVQLALAVPMVLYFHLFSLTGVLANVLVGVALTAAVPAGLLACLFGTDVLTGLTSWLVHFARRNAAFWAGMEPGFRIPDPPMWLALCCVAACAALSVALLVDCPGGTLTTPSRSRLCDGSVESSGYRAAIVRERWLRPGACNCQIVAATLCSALTTLLLVVAPFPPQVGGGFELTAIDVGQGDSLLLSSPEGRTLLIDAGGIVVFDNRTRPRLDIGEDVVSPYLWRRGLKRLDAVAITHLHEDHAGGMARVIANFRPSELWIGATVDQPIWHRIRDAARAAGTRVRLLTAGSTPALGSLKLRVLAPLADYQTRTLPTNDDSLVMLFEHGRHRFLLTGDAEADVEEQLAALPEVDVLKVGHHGSRTSTGDTLLAAIRPLFGVISAGEDNPYGHPHPLTLQRLLTSGVRVHRTDWEGLISITSDGRRLAISPQVP